MERFTKKIKYPTTAHDFKLRKEQRKIQNCEKLITKMGKVINNHELCRPATLSNLRGDLTLSSRIF